MKEKVFPSAESLRISSIASYKPIVSMRQYYFAGLLWERTKKAIIQYKTPIGFAQQSYPIVFFIIIGSLFFIVIWRLTNG
jgi:hypothetical protein